VTLTNAGVEGSSGAEHGVGIYGSNVSLINSGTIIAGGQRRQCRRLQNRDRQQLHQPG
jgi:hypothetical protein